MATRNGRNREKEAGLAIITTVIMMGLPIYAFLANPAFIIEFWEVFLLFVLLPFGTQAWLFGFEGLRRLSANVRYRTSTYPSAATSSSSRSAACRAHSSA